MIINKFDDTKLYELLERANIKEIDTFLEKYGINSVDRDGRTFLLSSIVKGDKKLAKHLIDNGLSLNAKDNAGFTALHFAVMSNQYEIADYLIAKGAKINCQDNFGNTPLWRAAMEYEDENNKMIQLLLMNGADPRIENKYGISAESLLSE